MKFLKYLYLNITFFASVIAFSLAAIPVFAFWVALCALFLPQRFTMKQLRWAILWYGAVIIRILPFPFVRVAHKNFAPDACAGPYIFICNHRSASDPFLMAVVNTECIQVVNIWPFRLPVWGIIARIAGYLSVREMPFKDFLSKTTRVLQGGCSIAVFPEGTRTRDGSVGQFHGAIFRTAIETKTPIVPLCITGNESVPPIGSIFLHPGVIKMHRLKPIVWEEYRELGPFKLKNHVRRMIMDEVAEMEKVA